MRAFAVTIHKSRGAVSTASSSVVEFWSLQGVHVAREFDLLAGWSCPLLEVARSRICCSLSGQGERRRMFRGASYKVLGTDATPWTSGRPSVRSGLCRAPRRVRGDEHGEVRRAKTTPNEWGTSSQAKALTPEILVQIRLLNYWDGMVNLYTYIYKGGFAVAGWRLPWLHACPQVPRM